MLLLLLLLFCYGLFQISWLIAVCSCVLCVFVFMYIFEYIFQINFLFSVYQIANGLQLPFDEIKHWNKLEWYEHIINLGLIPFKLFSFLVTYWLLHQKIHWKWWMDISVSIDGVFFSSLLWNIEFVWFSAYLLNIWDSLSIVKLISNQNEQMNKQKKQLTEEDKWREKKTK